MFRSLMQTHRTQTTFHPKILQHNRKVSTLEIYEKDEQSINKVYHRHVILTNGARMYLQNPIKPSHSRQSISEGRSARNLTFHIRYAVLFLSVRGTDFTCWRSTLILLNFGIIMHIVTAEMRRHT